MGKQKQWQKPQMFTHLGQTYPFSFPRLWSPPGLQTPLPSTHKNIDHTPNDFKQSIIVQETWYCASTTMFASNEFALFHLPCNGGVMGQVTSNKPFHRQYKTEERRVFIISSLQRKTCLEDAWWLLPFYLSLIRFFI